MKVKDDTLLMMTANVVRKDLSDISSVGRAIPCQGIGHRFEPDMSLQITI